MGYVKSIILGDFIEIYEYEKDLPKKKLFIRKKRVARIGDLRVLRYDNFREREKRFKRLIVANCGGEDSVALVTLTMLREVSVSLSYVFLKRFIRRLYQSQGRGFRYVAVLEFQKRGAIHFHVLIWGLPDYVIKEEKFVRNLQRFWQRGFVDCRSGYGNFTIANYLSKYLSKTMSDKRLCGRRAYCSSCNILRPVLVTSMSPFSYSKTLFGKDLRKEKPICEKHFISKWLGSGCYRLYFTK